MCCFFVWDELGQVESHLYATGDASVCPATPAALRSGGAKTVKGGGTARTGAGRAAAQSVGEGLPCGYSEAPGWRIVMEDSVCTCVGGTENLAAAPLGVEVFPSLLWRVERPARRLHWLTFFFV